ncbi:DMBT1 protein, partial [Nothocercus nigrocapillus]|nr:DMBT1 protein [Nothocercus nigrocapillus]
RLEGVGRRCAGRVEVKHEGQWGTVCSYGWDIKGAAVVCKQLGCGSALQAFWSAEFGRGSGPIWLSSVHCQGTETDLSECSHEEWGKHYCGHGWDSGVICSSKESASSLPLRLVNGSTACSGRVEIQVQGTWGTLCDSHWDISDAHVLCHQLNCGFAESIPAGGHFGKGIGPVWRDTFHCDGTETNLEQCPVTALGVSPCSPDSNAGVFCSGPSGSLRLVDRGNRCEGRVEMLLHRMWVRVLDDQWDLNDASVVCRQLQCGKAEQAYNPPKPERGMGPVGLRRVQCAGKEARLTLCNTSLPEAAPAGIAEDVGVVCSGDAGSRQVRLVHRAGRCAGRVEIYYNGTWGTICDDSWDLLDATVVCRQLGCGVAVALTGSAHYKEGSGKIWLDDVNCSGDEAALWDCPARPGGQHNCRHGKDAGVVCS